MAIASVGRGLLNLFRRGGRGGSRGADNVPTGGSTQPTLFDTPPTSTGAGGAGNIPTIPTSPGMRQLAVERTAQRQASRAVQPSLTTRAGGALLSQFQGSLPRNIAGIGILGAGAYMGGRAALNRFGPQDELARQQALEALMGGLDSPEALNQQAFETYMAPYRQGFTPDTEWESELRRQAAQQQQMLGSYGQNIGGAITGAYGDASEASAANAAALQALAEQTGLTIGELAESGAGGVEDMLYGGGMDVSGTSGLTPLPSNIADSPGLIRDAGQAAQESALRNLSLDARGFADESNLMGQLGPAMAQELQNELLLRQFDVGRESERTISEDRRARRLADEDLQRQALLEWSGIQAQQQAGELAERAQKQQVVRDLMLTERGQRQVESLFARWQAGDEANYSRFGLDFVDYVFDSTTQ